MWTRRKEIKEIPPMKGKLVAKPKEEGGWGLKNIHFFCK
jgi:hypothetical protein